MRSATALFNFNMSLFDASAVGKYGWGWGGEGLRGSGLLHSHMIVLIKSSNILVTVSFVCMLPFLLISIHHNSDYTIREQRICASELFTEGHCSSGYRKDGRVYRTVGFSNEPKLALVIIPSTRGNNEINSLCFSCSFPDKIDLSFINKATRRLARRKRY